MASKKYDLAVKVGEYTDRNGDTKGRYENIGAVMTGDKGPFLMLKKTFNPAGVPTQEGRDSILVSCFEPRQQDGQQSAPRQQPQQQAQQQAPAEEYDQDIPF